MEVLSGGFTTKYWIPIEDEPDIDRFIDEDIAVDLGSFTLRGLLKKVSTCKKKNKETKEFDYYKEITIEVVGIDSEAGQTISIPDKKDEYECAAEFRYIPDEDLEEKVEGPSLEVSEDLKDDLEADNRTDPADDPQDEAYEGDDVEFDEEQQAELDHRAQEELDGDLKDEAEFEKENNLDNPDDNPDGDFFEDPAPDAADGTPDDEFFDEPTQVDNATGEPDDKKEKPDDDDIDWS